MKSLSEIPDSVLDPNCKDCGSKFIEQWSEGNGNGFVERYKCKECGYVGETLNIGHYCSSAKRISGDGVFFRCSKCEYEPKMGSSTDDLLNMNFCPNCGRIFIK